MKTIPGFLSLSLHPTSRRFRMTFEEYLLEKKINPDAFRQGEPDRWNSLRELFEQVHPNSFTTQKKFLINDLRRKYLLSGG